ncbi:MAG: c-type cytochrome [Candidatus Tyrphobacter sp.]
MAVPVLANGQGGVTCGLCHTAVPHLNSYGRYLLMANFSRGLNKHLQMMQNRSLPVALEMTFNVSHPPDPLLPGVHSAIVQFLSAGFIGPNVSYFASVPVVTGGFPAGAIDQLWFAYNGFSHDNGSLQIGKFPTPIFAPWTSQSLSLTGYGLAGLHVGLNNSAIADNRWGASYTQFGHLGLIGNVSYVGGAGPIERAFSTPGEGTAVTGSIQYLSPESRWSGGIAGLSGSYPLPSGASDRYARAAALASYSDGRYELSAMGIMGHDDNPNDRASSPADSRGVSFETIYGPRSWWHLDVRYEHTDDGLGTSTVNYIFGSAFSLRPNIIFTVEDRASAGMGPVQNYQLLWAGPWFRNRFPPGSMPPAILSTRVETISSTPMPMSSTPMPMSSTPMPTSGTPMPASGTPMPASSAAMPTPPMVDPRTIANGRSIYFFSTDLNGVQIATATPGRVYQSCAVCHGPDGAGSVQLADGSISAKLGSQAHMLDQMTPMKGAMKPWTVALFERAISTGVDQNGEQLSPVMPRWSMSARDLHDIAVYISTQIR